MVDEKCIKLADLHPSRQHYYKHIMQKDSVKVKWFMLRTGASEEEAVHYLKLSKNKLEEAIRIRRFNRNITQLVQSPAS
jgi:hypothetical protein